MSKAKRRLTKAIGKTKNLDDSWFGSEEANFEDLPSIRNKKDKVRKNIFIDSDVADFIEKESKKHNVGFTSIANDILCSFVRAKMVNLKK